MTGAGHDAEEASSREIPQGCINAVINMVQ